MIFTSKDSKYKFLLQDKIFRSMLRYVRNSEDMETGGILIGSYSQDTSTAIVTKITGPPKDSRRGFSWFERGLKGLQKLLNKRWLNHEYYLGEWHYHPLSAPTPSFQDLYQMRVISSSKSYHCPEPILMIIGGDAITYDISVFVTLPHGLTMELIKNDAKRNDNSGLVRFGEIICY